jgi:hypothetical protein
MDGLRNRRAIYISRRINCSAVNASTPNAKVNRRRSRSD